MSEMKQSVQAVQCETLKALHEVCEKHGIRYFLAQGTLLGAAKYKGFIPWDDDVDLFVPWQELPRMEEAIRQSADPKYRFVDYHTEAHYPLPWAKVRNNNTLSRPVRYRELPISWGISLDLFGLYPISDNPLLRKMEYFRFKLAAKMLFAGMTQYEEGHGIVNRILEKIPLKLRHRAMDSAKRALIKHGDGTKYLLIPARGTHVIPRELIYGEPVMLPFGDGMYPAPARYHEFLTYQYGDYMAPLPADKQMGHELTMGEIEWKFE